MAQDQNQHSWRHFGDTMSPDNQGVYQLKKKETQQAIVKKYCLAKNHPDIIWYIALFVFTDPPRSIHAPQYRVCDR